MLLDYLNKNVNVVLKNGKRYIGKVDMYTPAIDNDSPNEDSIGVLTGLNEGVEIYEGEIDLIEIV